MTAVDELKILKANLPNGDIEEKFVNEYHSILTATQNQTGQSLSEHFIQSNELKTRPGIQRFDDYGELIEASHSSARYCDRNLFTFKLDRAIARLDSIGIDRQVTEHPEKKVYSLPKIPLTEPESLWLREVYKGFKKGEEVEIKALKVKLLGRIPPDFEPERIDERLLLYGRIITLYGVWHADPDTGLLSDADLIIRKIRELIFKDTKRKSIKAEEVAHLAKLPLPEVESLIKHIRLLGFFWSEVEVASNVGYSEVQVNDKGVFEEYYRYEGVEQLIARLNERYRSNASLVDTSDLPLVPNIKPASDSNSIRRAEQLYERVESLSQDTKNLDRDTAKLIIELADDAIKEFGNTEQEKKVKLKRWKTQAELALPPATIDELKKRAEGQLLTKTYPKQRTVRSILFAAVVIAIVIPSLLAVRQFLTAQDDKAKSTQTPRSEVPSVDDSQKFVRLHYYDFYNREPDAKSIQFWTSEIERCGADAQCRAAKRVNISAAFFLSIEFQETGYFVYRVYKVAYGDTTSPGVTGTVPVVRFQELLPDTWRIGQGVVVGQDNWDQRLKANKTAYMVEFVQRPRFLAAFPLSVTPAEFVDRLNQNADSVLTRSERDQLVAQLKSSADVTAERAGVLRSVAEHEALRRNEFTRAFVLMLYHGYLRRNPDDPPDPDFHGWRVWLDRLNQFKGDFTKAGMINAFINSNEYRQRLAH